MIGKGSRSCGAVVWFLRRVCSARPLILLLPFSHAHLPPTTLRSSSSSLCAPARSATLLHTTKPPDIQWLTSHCPRSARSPLPRCRPRPPRTYLAVATTAVRYALLSFAAAAPLLPRLRSSRPPLPPCRRPRPPPRASTPSAGGSRAAKPPAPSEAASYLVLLTTPTTTSCRCMTSPPRRRPRRPRTRRCSMAGPSTRSARS